MANESSPRRRFSVPKILYLPLVLGLFAIGLLGTLIPVIPGILFLVLAVVILAKVYPAFRRAIGNPGYLRRTERRYE